MDERGRDNFLKKLTLFYKWLILAVLAMVAEIAKIAMIATIAKIKKLLPKMSIFLRIIFSLLFVVLPLAGGAQSKVRLHGKVTDANNDPVEFATVRIGGTATGTTTSLEGDYPLPWTRDYAVVV